MQHVVDWRSGQLAGKPIEIPKPYRWKAKGREILEKIQRARQALSAA
jgi:hypothetical protein